MELKDVVFHGVENVIWREQNYHYIDILMTGKVDTAYNNEPKNSEPDKCYGNATD